MKLRTLVFVGLSSFFITAGTALSADQVTTAGSAPAADRTIRLEANADTVDRLAAESDEAAALARFLQKAELRSQELSGMLVVLNMPSDAAGNRQSAKLLVQYHPTSDRQGLLLRVTSEEPGATSKTMMDLEYRRASTSTPYQLVGWRKL